MSWRRIRLELAPTPDFANGSRMHGYDLIAPLDTDGQLDEAAWRANTARATVRRFWEGEGEQRGHLARAGDGGWAFSFTEAGGGEHSLEADTLNVGNHVTVTDTSGATFSFRVAAVRMLATA
jgi:hypothetical protein